MDESKSLAEQAEQLERALKTNRHAEDRGAFYLGVFFVLLALAIPAYQVLGWLKTAHWEEFPLRYAWLYFGYPSPFFEWAGVQKIFDWVADLPLLIVPALIGYGNFLSWWDSK